MDLNTLYSQLVLRDLLGYIAPGAIVSAAIGIRILGGWEKFFSHIKALPTIAWIPLLSVIYLVGIAVAVPLIEVHPNRYFAYHNYSSDEEFLKQLADFKFALVNFKDEANDLRQHHERFVILKQGAANGAGALLFSFIILMFPSKWQIEMPSLGNIAIVLAVLLAIVSLQMFHYRNREQQRLWEQTVISRVKHQSTGSVSKIPPKVQPKDGQHSTDSVNEIPPKVQPKDDQHQRR